jgi:hypothetical protein
MFLGAFEKLRKATISYVSCVRASAGMELGFTWAYVHKIQYQSIFHKSVNNIQVRLKSDNINRYFT